jgi:hypothetical protein
MKTKSIVILSLAVLILASCVSAAKAVPIATVSPFPFTITPSPTLTIDQLRAIIYASNPQSPQYDPKSAAYAEFPEAIKQLLMMRTNAIDAASDLALAITFPRQDSYLAAQALISLGPDTTSTTIDILFHNLDSNSSSIQNPEALIYSTIVLSTTGNNASCAVGNIGPLLWNADSRVRSAAAFALDRITNKHLIASQYKIVIDPSFLADSVPTDEPVGSISDKAREWWNNEGSKVKWHSSYGFCDP